MAAKSEGESPMRNRPEISFVDAVLKISAFAVAAMLPVAGASDNIGTISFYPSLVLALIIFFSLLNMIENSHRDIIRFLRSR